MRGDDPRNKQVVDDDKENTLVTLPLKDVEELRQKLRNLEDINTNLSNKINDAEEVKKRLGNLEKTNQVLLQKLKDSEEKVKQAGAELCQAQVQLC